MCVICYSPAGHRLPTLDEITTMFVNNHDGAGYMYLRNGKVIIRKGFDNVRDLMRSVKADKITTADVIVYHFRIATQGFRFEMSQPFAITNDEQILQSWDVEADAGIAHNGIIRMTSTGDEMFSDTAIYIRDHLAGRRITDKFVKTVESEAGGKMIFLLADGSVHMTGRWVYDDGLLFSNTSYLPWRY